MNQRSRTALGWISELLKTIWTFFPSLLFIFLALYAFWLQSAGKDIIVAFTEERPLGSLSRVVFFLAIAFWVYVTWYSSRMIGYIKQRWPQDELGLAILDVYPRLAGHACFLVLELAVLQSPVFGWSIGAGKAAIILLAGLLVLFVIDRWVRDRWAVKSGFVRVFWGMLIVFLALLAAAALFFPEPETYRYILVAILFVLHTVFLLYSNLHRADVQYKMMVLAKAAAVGVGGAGSKGVVGSVGGGATGGGGGGATGGDGGGRSIWVRVMDYFCIPRAEDSYFGWFNIVGALGLAFYIWTIASLGFAKGAGPFPFLILAFGVLLGVANLITGFSVRYRVNFHFLLFVAAFVLGLQETHHVKTLTLENGVVNGYDSRPDLETYLRAWLDARVPLSDTTSGPYDVYFILSNGGASRSGYWTSSILGRLEDSTVAWMKKGATGGGGTGAVRGGYGRFSDHLFCLSGTSGGGVGVATFFSMLQDKRRLDSGSYVRRSGEFLQQDFFTFTVARMLGPDYLNYITHFSSSGDRGRALEEGLEWSSEELDSANYTIPFYKPLSGFRALDARRQPALPLLFVNTTRMQDGNPGVVTNLRLDSSRFNKRIDVLCLLDSNKDISLASGAILGARFPYLSPAGNLAHNNYFVDGGYFDNSGAGVVQETIQGILDIMREDSLQHGQLYKQVRRLRFHVLHIVNSPVGPPLTKWPPEKPIENDLFSPLITIVGAYDMQTTVNDLRLDHFIKGVSAQGIEADHKRISLYLEMSEWPKDPATGELTDTEAVYPMNWFMSERTRTRMDRRLESQPVLDSLISGIRKEVER